MDYGAFGWVLVVLIVVGLPVYLQHREKMAKLMGQRTDPNPQLLTRIEALEKKCEKLQEQVNTAHTLIHDEQLQLDRKLSIALETQGAK